MSALGQKQTCAVHKPMSAKCQKRTFGNGRHKQKDRLAAASPKSDDVFFESGCKRSSLLLPTPAQQT
jgi:hypothetical protein